MKCLALFIALLISTPSYSVLDQVELEQLFKLSLEEVLKIRVVQPSTLTKTSQKTVPASVTTITQKDIQLSAARSMNELLEIYVPGLQYIGHQFGFSHLGARGIMSDRDDKYLLLVNGRTMNDRTVVGVITERDLNILGDIHHIDIVRGAGSATYGLGAVSMVINVVTLNHLTFEGQELTTSSGAGERYDSLEYKWGKKLSNHSGIFTYIGISNFTGASYKDAPMRFSASGTLKDGSFISAESDVTMNTGRDKIQHRNNPKLKSHIDVQFGDFSLWARYTRGGKQNSPNLEGTFLPPIGSSSVDISDPVQMGSQQFTLMSQYNHTLSKNWSINYGLSYDVSDYERLLGLTNFQTYREDEALGKVTAHWEPEGIHSLAIGLDTSYEKFGLDSPGFPHQPSRIPGYFDNPNEWTTYTHSFYFEHQWRIQQNWTSFISARLDKNTYTHTLFSPRISQVWVIDELNTIKAILSRSQRMNFAVDMRTEFLKYNNTDSNPEVLDSLEFRWEHIYDKNISSGLVVYAENIDLIGFVPGENTQQVIAEEKQWGLEFELALHTDLIDFEFSHTYTHMYYFDLKKGVSFSYVTTEPNGYGDKLNNWSNHLSKLNARYQLNDKLLMHGSVVYYWAFDGIKDNLEYQTDIRIANGDAPLYEFGNDEISGSNVYLNLGVNYAIQENLNLGFNGYNLLGLIDMKYNKRNYFQSSDGSYRLQAVSLSVYANLLF